MRKYLPWTKSAVHKICSYCKKPYICWPYEEKRRRYCGLSCRSRDQKRWKGKAIKAHGKYKRIWNGFKYIPEHRFIIEKHIGRKLRKDEIVHHVNHKTGDNRINNLEIMSRGNHTSHHHKGIRKEKSIAGMRRWQQIAPKCGKPIKGWQEWNGIEWIKILSGSPCRKPMPCPMH